MEKFVYSFNEGNREMRNTLGGKGANLAEMINIGLAVPTGFTVSTNACTEYYNNKKSLSDEMLKQIDSAIEKLEKETGKKFGDKENPLLVSVRSGSRVSMPGMMDTVLNLGMNDEVAEALIKKTNNPRFVYDSYRRFIMMFADVVKGYSKSSFDKILDTVKSNKGITNDLDLTSEDMKEITQLFKDKYFELAKSTFPTNPKKQLLDSISAVFNSWNNDRAIIYRKMNDIPSSWGTAVNVQMMVYGNSGENSGTGVAFTRNPATGENKLFGEYLINAQGEDVVAGVRTPKPIENLKEIMPEVYEEFCNNCQILEKHYKDMQDMEFTIEDGKLYMLQTRNGKRTATSAIKIAVDLVKEGLLTKEEALLIVDPKSLDQLLHKSFDSDDLKKANIIASGLAASPGAATGKVYFSASDAIEASKKEEDVILVTLETSPEDIEGMSVSKGVLTVRGGMTSHAAVVARGMGTCCVCGCEDLIIDEENKTFTTKDGLSFAEGDYLSIDGNTGNVYKGKIKTVEPVIDGDFDTLMKWADDIRTLKVRANADTPEDALVSLKYKAEGIGLVRTEHMFFDPERLFAIRKMIVAPDTESRQEALNSILPIQQEDFIKIFEVMNGFPVTIRYLDPPLHEFLPSSVEEIKELASSLNITYDKLKQKVDSLQEFNPMMGHRGCRLAITYPEIAIMQTKAIIGAAIHLAKAGKKVYPEIMVPLVGDIKEFEFVKNIIDKTANKLMKSENVEVKYTIGTMIEIPRAALLADEVAKSAKFFSFGTNDLTQMTYGFSRDDAAKFLTDYYDKKVFDNDPFVKLDQKGVGKLVKTAVELGKQVRSDIKLGICGEHGGDPASIEFCHNIGLDYVSCSPYRVVTARLAAAQAVLENK